MNKTPRLTLSHAHTQHAQEDKMLRRWGQRGMNFLKLFDGQVDDIPKRLELFSFREVNALKPRWTASIMSDVSWGGKSVATFRVEDGRGIFEGDISKEKESTSDTRPDQLGFAAVTFQQIDKEYIICNDYQNLVIKARADAAHYSVTLRGVAILAPELVYQGFIKGEQAEIVEMILPFESFVATRAGRMSSQQLILDGGVRFTAITFAVVAQNTDFQGPFRFEIEALEASNDDLGTIEHQQRIAAARNDYLLQKKKVPGGG